MTQAFDCVDAQTVRFERLLPGPIERVWDYLTRPELQHTWLAESVSELSGITRCQPLRSIEFSMRDSRVGASVVKSVVSIELEPRGAEVRLVLTHRRLPAWLAGAGTALAVALLVFSGCRPEQTSHPRQPLGREMTQSAPSLNSLHLKPSHFTVC